MKLTHAVARTVFECVATLGLPAHPSPFSRICLAFSQPENVGIRHGPNMPGYFSPSCLCTCCSLSQEYPSSFHLLMNYYFSLKTQLNDFFSDTFPDKIDLPQGPHSSYALSTFNGVCIKVIESRFDTGFCSQSAWIPIWASP